MKEKNSQYAELVYLRRVVKKIPAPEVAKALGVSTETYLRSERGEREFTLQEAMKIANIMGMPISFVFPKIFEMDVAENATN